MREMVLGQVVVSENVLRGGAVVMNHRKRLASLKGGGSAKEKIRAIAQLRQWASHRGVEFQEEVGEAFLSVLEDGEHFVQLEAMLALGRLGVDEGRVVPVLLRRLRFDDVPEVRGYAAIALGYFGVRAGEIVPLMCEWLEHSPYAGLRVCAAIALGHFGGEASESVPLLIRALNLDMVFARREGAKFLKHYYALEESLGLPDLQEDFQVFPDELTPGRELDRLMREAAVEALGRIGRSAVDAVPGLVQVLRREPPWLQRKAAWALGELGMATTSVLAGLQRELQNFDEKVKFASAIALRKLNFESPEMAAVLLDLMRCQLQDLCWVTDEAFLLEVGHRLLEVTGAICASLPALQRGLQDAPRVRRARLDEICEGIEHQTRHAIAELGSFLADEREPVRDIMNEVWRVLQEMQGILGRDSIDFWRGEYEQILFD